MDETAKDIKSECSGGEHHEIEHLNSKKVMEAPLPALNTVLATHYPCQSL